MLAVVDQVPEVRALQRKGVGLEALQALQKFVGHGAAVRATSLHQGRLGGVQVHAQDAAAPRLQLVVVAEACALSATMNL